MSYTKLLYHIIFRTKYSENTIPNEQSEKLYRYMWGFVNNHKSKLYRVNGMPDHIHLLIDLHPKFAVADFVKKLKNSTNNWLKNNKESFPSFKAWAVGYCALSYSEKDKDTLVDYIANQREHHKKELLKDEVRRLLANNGVDINEHYFLKD